MSDVVARAKEALDRALGVTGSTVVGAMQAVNDVAEAVSWMPELIAEVERLQQVEFIHGGCEMLRRKDNEHLLAKVESLRATLARVRELADDQAFGGRGLSLQTRILAILDGAQS